MRRVVVVAIGSLLSLFAVLWTFGLPYDNVRVMETGHRLVHSFASNIQGGVAPKHNKTGVFVTLGRNEDLYSLAETIQSVEDRFNHKYHYDWVFFHNEPFDEEFIMTTRSLISSEATYVQIPAEMWSYPPHIDQSLAAEARDRMKNSKYGDSESYRFMCRFFSGFFYKHPVLAPYKYFWRVDTDIKLSCDVDYDVFEYMETHNKTYGFTISLLENADTVPSIWQSSKGFLEQFQHLLPEGNMLRFVTDDDGETYNLCHFWSNFEVASLDFFRSKEYNQFFDYLDKSGGFFYERWGDAPVHSIGASLLLRPDQFHYFDDFGYWHDPYLNCPTSRELRRKKRCSCNPRNNFTWKQKSCQKRYFEIRRKGLPEEWEHQT